MAVLGMVFTGIALFALMTYFKKWKWLWDEWITTVDPKRIGIMYSAVALTMLLKGFADAIMMRIQQALGTSGAFISPEHYQEVFTAHGTTMIFLSPWGLFLGFLI